VKSGLLEVWKGFAKLTIRELMPFVVPIALLLSLIWCDGAWDEGTYPFRSYETTCFNIPTTSFD